MSNKVADIIVVVFRSSAFQLRICYSLWARKIVLKLELASKKKLKTNIKNIIGVREKFRRKGVSA